MYELSLEDEFATKRQDTEVLQTQETLSILGIQKPDEHIYQSEQGAGHCEPKFKYTQGN